MHAVEIKNLFKSYGGRDVLRDVTFHVQPGEVYGILGPDGAGKSTLLHILMGFLKPMAGTVRLLGSENLATVRGRVGYVPEQMTIYHLHCTAREYLSFLGVFSAMDDETLPARVDEELAHVGLRDAADKKLTTFSSGMIQRLTLAQALLTDPELVLIDDPTSGADSSLHHDLIEMLSRLRSQGITLLICTHHLDMIEHLCDRVGVLIQGRLVSEADVSQVRGLGNSVNIRVSHMTPDLRNHLRNIAPSSVHCGEYVVTLRPNNHTLQATVIRTLLDADVAILGLESLERPLELLYTEAIRSPSRMGRLPVSPTVSVSLPASSLPSSQTFESEKLLKELLESGQKPETTSTAHPSGAEQQRTRGDR